MVKPCRSQCVKTIPNATGKQLWKTMAPVILPRARMSLCFPTQIMELHFSGSSVAIHRVAAAGTRREEQDEIHIGKAVYARTDAGSWSVRTGSDQATRDLVDELRLVTDPRLLSVGGPETREGQQVLHVTAAGAIPYRTANPGGGHYDAWDLWVTTAGLPVHAEVRFTATDGSGNPLTGSIDYGFTHVGGPISISPPLVNGSPLPTPAP